MTAASQPSPAGGDDGRYLYDALLAFLGDDGWPIAQEDRHERAVAVTVEGNSGRWICAGQIMDGRPLLLFSSILPIFIPAPARQRVSEFLHRANAGLLYGGFQFDIDEGEVRYVTSLDLSAVDPAATVKSGLLTGLLRRMVYANVATVDQYLSALMSVVHAGAEPAEVVAEAELSGSELARETT